MFQHVPRTSILVLGLTGTSLTAVESQFLEPYTASARKKFIQDKYFNGDKKRWQSAGLAEAQRTAEAVREGALSFRYLDALRC